MKTVTLRFEEEFPAEQHGRVVRVYGVAEGKGKVERSGYYEGHWYMQKDPLKLIADTKVYDAETGEFLGRHELTDKEKRWLEVILKGSDEWTMNS